MAKRIMILIYIAAVLAISGFSRADSRTIAAVANASLDTQTSILTIHGLASMNCEQRPRIEVSSVDIANRSLTLKVTSSGKVALCADILAKPFELSYDLRQINLQAGVTYNLTFENIMGPAQPLSYAPAQNEGKGGSFAQANIDGILINGFTGFAVNNGSKNIPVVGSSIDLSQYVNRQVTVSGVFNSSTEIPTGFVVPTSISTAL